MKAQRIIYEGGGAQAPIKPLWTLFSGINPVSHSEDYLTSTFEIFSRYCKGLKSS